MAVINGRLGEKSFRGYRRIRPLVAGLLRQIDLLAVQDETYAERFRALGARPETVHVTGSMKYDGAQTDRGNPATRRLAALAGFSPDDIVLLAGSTQEPEEEMALATFRELSPQWPQLRLVLVPRHPDRFEAVARLLGFVRHRLAAADGVGRGRAESGGTRGSRRRRRQETEIRCIRTLHLLLPLPTPPSLPSPLASSWSTWSANWAPGGARRGSRLSAGAWAAAAGRT